MKRCLVLFVGFMLAASSGWAMDWHQGFDGKAWGSDCQEIFVGDGWKTYGAHPVWNKKNRTLTLPFDEASAARSKFVLKYNQTQQTSFEDFTVLNIYYGCSRETGKLSMVVVRYSAPSAQAILKRLTERLGKPTHKNIVQTIWDLDDIYVQFDQSIVIFYWKQAGPPH